MLGGIWHVRSEWPYHQVLSYSSLPNTSLGQDNSLGWEKSENLGQHSSLGWEKEKT